METIGIMFLWIACSEGPISTDTCTVWGVDLVKGHEHVCEDPREFFRQVEWENKDEQDIIVKWWCTKDQSA